MFNEFKLKDELKDWLIDASDSNRIEDIIKIKQQNLKEMSSKNKHGYAYEFQMWEFFLSLKPNYISDINRPAILKIDENVDKNKPELEEKTIDSYKSKTQNDIVVIFDRHIFLVECKSTKEKLNYTDLKSAASDVFTLRSYKNSRLEYLFGEDKFIPIHMIASKGYEISSKEHEKCYNKHQTIIFSEKYKEYIDTVKENSQSAEFAYIQLLGFYRKNKPDYGPANYSSFCSKSGEGGKHNVYTFSISPEEMLKISTVSHQAKNLIFQDEPKSIEYYQRLLQRGRIKDIAEWLDEKSQPFPNNILVSYRGGSDLVWEKRVQNTNSNKNKKTAQNNNFKIKSISNEAGNLKFNACPGTFHVIDGQHRLFSYTGVEKKPGGIREKHRLIVTAFEGMTTKEEAEMFLDVNQNARPIAPGVILEIQYGTREVCLDNLATSVLFKLRENKDSILFKKINTAEGRGKLKTKNSQGYIKDMDILNGEKYSSGYFWPINKAKTWTNLQEASTHIYTHIDSLFKVINKEIPELWFKPNRDDLKKNKRGLLQDIIFGGIIGVIDRITISEIRESDSFSELTEKCKPIIRSLVDGIKKESNKELQEKTLNLAQYPPGARGNKVVTAYFIYKFLPKRDFPDLTRPEDAERIRYIADEKRTKEEMEILDKYQKNLLVEVNKAPKKVEKVKRKARNARGALYHSTMKTITQATFSHQKHLNGDPWDALIVPAELDKDNSTGFPLDYKMWKKDKRKGGANVDYSPFMKVEGSDLGFLLSNPKYIRKAVPGGHEEKEERINKTIQFIWDNLIILPKGKKKPIRVPSDDSPLWKEGVEYIDLFYEFRAYTEGLDPSDPHYADGVNTLQKLGDPEFPKFDFYEKKFKEMVITVKDELNLLEKQVSDIYDA